MTINQKLLTIRFY